MGQTDIPGVSTTAVHVLYVTCASLFLSLFTSMFICLSGFSSALKVPRDQGHVLPTSMSQQVASDNVLHLMRVSVENVSGIFNISNYGFTKIRHTLF